MARGLEEPDVGDAGDKAAKEIGPGYSDKVVRPDLTDYESSIAIRRAP
jgi:hypothetical protein